MGSSCCGILTFYSVLEILNKTLFIILSFITGLIAPQKDIWPHGKTYPKKAEEILIK
jgi:hypothetical protein